MIDTAELRRLAEKAKSETWIINEGNHREVDFKKACSPSAVLELLDEMAAELDLAQEATKVVWAEKERMKARLDAAEKVCEKLDNHYCHFDCLGQKAKCDVIEDEYPWDQCEEYWVCKIRWEATP